MATDTIGDIVSNDKQNPENTPLNMAKVCVDELYHFRDHFFETEGVERAAEKPAMVKQKLELTLERLDQLMAEKRADICISVSYNRLEVNPLSGALLVLQKSSDNTPSISGQLTIKGQIPDKSMYNFLRGKAHNVTATFDPQALECLSRAVKLNPKMVEAWNQLGECYWKKEDLENAKNCFTGALNHIKNKESLRSLSMVMRQLAVDQSERNKIVAESLEKAKEAVELDIMDGTSWFVLGNAYLSNFFAQGQNTNDLERCFQAYSQAEKDPVATGNPDLHQNRAVANQFNEDYQKALDGYCRASSLDPAWKDPIAKEMQIMDYLQQVADLVASRGKIKEKKLQSVCQSISEGDLGRYSGGSYTSQSGQTVKLVKSFYANLEAGLNGETVIVGRVISVLNTAPPIPTTVLLVDEMGDCFPVTLYNSSTKHALKLYDSVVIPEPYVQSVNVLHKQKEYAFSSIRVSSPRVLIVNKKKLGQEHVQSNTLAINAISQ